jgi:AAA family ATP:ADP antiporter
MMLLKQSAYAALNIKAEEEKPVLLMLCYSFFSGVSIYIFYLVANALFLVNYDKSMLPVAYIGGGVLLFFIGRINVSFQRKVNFSRLSIILILFQLVAVAAMLYSYETTALKWITLVMFIWNRISVYVNNVTFWTSSSKIFNLEQAKRIFSLIATGDVVASIVSYFSVNVLLNSKVMRTEELLYICMAALVVSLGFMLAIIGSYHQKLAVRTKDVSQEVVNELDDQPVFKREYQVLLLLLGMLPVLGVYFGEFIFSVEVKRQFPTKDQLTLFLGQFFFVSAIIELLVKVFFYRFAIRTFGLVSGIIILPVALIIVLSLAILFTSLDYTVFFYILLSRFLCISIKKSFSDTSFQILYQPLSKTESHELQNKVEIYAKPLGYILAGVILLALMYIGLGEPVQIMTVFVVILIGWTFAAFKMQSAYQLMLSNLFSGLSGMFQTRKTEVEPVNTESGTSANLRQLPFEELTRLATSDIMEDRLEAIELLGQSKRFLAFKYLIPFLQDSNDGLKAAAIKASAANGNPELWPYLFENICSDTFFAPTQDALTRMGDRILPALNDFFDKSDDSPEIQNRVIGIVKQIESDNALRFLRQKLSHPALSIRHRVYDALASKGYGVKLNERPGVVQEVGQHIAFMVWIIAAQKDLIRSRYLHSEVLQDALTQEYMDAVSELINILTILTGEKRLYFIQDSVRSRDENTRSYLLEILNMAIPAEHKIRVLPLFEDIPLTDRLVKLQGSYPQQKLSGEERLHDMINKDFSRLSIHTKALAIRELENFPSEDTSFTLAANAVSPVKIIAEAALDILHKTDPRKFEELYQTMQWSEDDFHCSVCRTIEAAKIENELLNPATS